MSSTEPRGCLFAIFNLLNFGRGRSDSAEALPYRLRDDFLSAAELSFFRVLQTAVGTRAVITCKVRLADLFYVPRPNENRGAHNRIDRKHVDFLLCDPATMRPLLAIELDDSSHRQAKRVERDVLVDRVFEAAGLPLVRFAVRAAYNPQQIAADLTPYLVPPPQPAVASLAAPDSPPVCVKCGIPMVQRVAAKGPRAGQTFWGCLNYPRCRATA